MKTTTRVGLGFIAAGVALYAVVCLSGCGVLGFNTGEAARRDLAPQMSALWPVIAEEVAYGIDRHPTIDRSQATLALDEWSREFRGDAVAPDSLAVRLTDEADVDDVIRLRDRDWVFFAAYATQGIVAREFDGGLGATGVLIALDNVAWFEAALLALDGSVVMP